MKSLICPISQPALARTVLAGLVNDFYVADKENRKDYSSENSDWVKSAFEQVVDTFNAFDSGKAIEVDAEWLAYALQFEGYAYDLEIKSGIKGFKGIVKGLNLNYKVGA